MEVDLPLVDDAVGFLRHAGGLQVGVEGRKFRDRHEDALVRLAIPAVLPEELEEDRRQREHGVALVLRDLRPDAHRGALEVHVRPHELRELAAPESSAGGRPVDESPDGRSRLEESDERLDRERGARDLGARRAERRNRGHGVGPPPVLSHEPASEGVRGRAVLVHGLRAREVSVTRLVGREVGRRSDPGERAADGLGGEVGHGRETLRHGCEAEAHVPHVLRRAAAAFELGYVLLHELTERDFERVVEGLDPSPSELGGLAELVRRGLREPLVARAE
ncbi:MAG TPA: hypothetical protein VFF73_30790 [Planctomycetota bacterium]|nr:hypothetical protein [Planctomycetota bacterium]